MAAKVETVRTGNGCSKWLRARGFVPNTSVKRKIAGAPLEWRDADGRRALVDYCLYSRTGQSSRGSAAVWGYTVTIFEAAQG